VDRLSPRRISDHKMVQWSVTSLALTYAVQHGAVLTSEFRVATSCGAHLHAPPGAGLTLGDDAVFVSWRTCQSTFHACGIVYPRGPARHRSLLFYAFVQPSAEGATRTASTTKQAAFAHTTSPAQPGSISVDSVPGWSRELRYCRAFGTKEGSLGLAARQQCCAAAQSVGLGGRAVCGRVSNHQGRS
jgi:hypothetical protein